MYVSDIVNNFKKQYTGYDYLIGVSAIINNDGKILFTIGKEEYWSKQSGNYLIGFSCVGGKVESNESSIQAIKREAYEETGSEINVNDVDHTSYIDIDGEITKLALQDEIKPQIIFEQQNKGTPGNPNVKGLWYLLVLVYNITLTDDPFPSSEVPAFIYIKKNKLKGFKSKNNISLNNLIETHDDMLLQRSIPDNSLLYPQFTAKMMIKHESIW